MLYQRVLEPLGFDYGIDLTHCGEARCSGVVRRSREAVSRPAPRPGP